MIKFKKKENVWVIEFDIEDAEIIVHMLHRALNTWPPNPPRDLLDVQADIIKSCQ